jgi:malate synthase
VVEILVSWSNLLKIEGLRDVEFDEDEAEIVEIMNQMVASWLMIKDSINKGNITTLEEVIEYVDLMVDELRNEGAEA